MDNHMSDFVFVGYTLRERFALGDGFEEYIRTTGIGTTAELYTVDISLLPEVSPYDNCKFEVIGMFTNMTTFSFNLNDMKQHLKDNNVIIGAFVERSAIDKIKSFDEKEFLFSYAIYADIAIDSEFKFRGFEVVSDKDYQLSANTNCGYSKDYMNEFGDVDDGLLFIQYESACKFRDYLNNLEGTDHSPFSVWQIWST